jgi:hypothetical protein
MKNSRAILCLTEGNEGNEDSLLDAALHPIFVAFVNFCGSPLCIPFFRKLTD